MNSSNGRGFRVLIAFCAIAVVVLLAGIFLVIGGGSFLGSVGDSLRKVTYPVAEAYTREQTYVLEDGSIYVQKSLKDSLKDPLEATWIHGGVASFVVALGGVLYIFWRADPREKTPRKKTPSKKTPLFKDAVIVKGPLKVKE